MRGWGVVSVVIALLGLATPGQAGMRQDLAACTASDRLESAAACTRVLESGQLPRAQHYIAYVNRGWSYRNGGDHEKALEDFDEAARRAPDKADIYYSRSVVLNDLGRRDDAVRDVERYLQLKDGDAAATSRGAAMMRRLGEPDRALALLERAAELDPNNERVPVLRALVLSDKGDQEAADAEIEAALAARPGNAGAYHARALIAFRQDRLAEAKADAERTIELARDHVAAHTLLGRIAAAEGDEAAAARHFKDAQALPARSIDDQALKGDAARRLAALGEGKSAPQVAAGDLDCRHFAPSVGVTLPVDCGD